MLFVYLFNFEMILHFIFKTLSIFIYHNAIKSTGIKYLSIFLRKVQNNYLNFGDRNIFKSFANRTFI